MNIKKLIKSFFSWAISNLIWTILTYILPLSLFIPMAHNIYMLAVKNNNTINIISVILLIIGIIIEILVFIGFKKFKKNLEISDAKKEIAATSDSVENNLTYSISKDNDLEDLDFYFKEYHKHLTVYKNGNGIIINSFKIIFNNIDNVKPFKRELNIKDSKISTQFPKLSKMRKTDLKYRFEKFGFWCKCYDNDKLISSIFESYWTDDNISGDTISENDPRILKWILKLNPSSIEIGKPYKIVYVISIPGMFPIENGLFTDNLANIKGTKGQYKSRFTVRHKIQKFYYTVSFENGIDLYINPQGELNSQTSSKNLHFEADDNIIYEKYNFIVDNPEINSILNINWQFKQNFQKT